MSGEDLDPSLLVWDIHRNPEVDYVIERFGDSRRVLQFEFADYATKYHYWWLLVEGGDSTEKPSSDQTMRLPFALSPAVLY